MTRIWDRFLTERDKALNVASNFGQIGGFGQRPALLVIDVNYAFCGKRSQPILEAIKEYSTACGEDAWHAMPHICRLIDAAHDHVLPLIYTTGQRRADGWDSGSWTWKFAQRQTATAVAGLPDGNLIVDDIAPLPHDIIVTKRKPSAFFGTDLASFLTLLRCDSLIVTGATTSGCVRATVLDAFSLNYRVTVVEEACFDRTESSHAISLFDMHSKYADVLGIDTVVEHISGMPKTEYPLPAR